MQVFGIPGSLVKLMNQHQRFPDVDYSMDDIPAYLQVFGDSTYRQGALGELMFVTQLVRKLRKVDCFLINACRAPFESTSREADHVLLHPNMLAVIETKYWLTCWDTDALKDQVESTRKAIHMKLYKSGIRDFSIQPVIYCPTGAIQPSDVGRHKGIEQRVIDEPEYLVDHILTGQHTYDLEKLVQCKDILLKGPFTNNAN